MTGSTLRCSRAFTVAVAALLALLIAAPVLAAPVRSASDAPTRTGSGSLGTSRLGAANVSLDTSAAVVPEGGTFRFAARTEYARPIEYLQARLRIYTPNGTMFFQDTAVKHDVEPGVASFEFVRAISDLGLQEGAYPAELSMRASISGETTETVIKSSLLVYDPNSPRVRIAPVIRIGAQPMSDAEGRLMIDPATATRARDDARRIARWVLSEPRAHLTMALSPMMVEEWLRVADGYAFETAEISDPQVAEDPVPTAYARALADLRAAVRTGRLEIVSLGYSDPDLTELQRAGLSADIRDQYERGARAIAAALETTPTPITAPARGALARESLGHLARIGITGVIADAAHVRSGDATGAAGVYSSATKGLRVISADRGAGAVIADGTVAQISHRSFDQSLGSVDRSVPMMIDVGPAGADADSVLAAVRQLAGADWGRLVCARDLLADPPAAKASVITARTARSAPRDFWPAVAEARVWAGALLFAQPNADGDAEMATVASLVAESAVWQGPSGDWSLAWRGLDFAGRAYLAAKAVFDDITISVQPVALAGSSGTVPATITNDTEQDVRVMVTLHTDDAVRLTDGAGGEMVLRPGDNLIEIPVELKNSLRGDMEIVLRAGDAVVGSAEVELSASYLDRLAMVGAIVVVLAALLVFIVRRVKVAEADAAETGVTD